MSNQAADGSVSKLIRNETQMKQNKEKKKRKCFNSEESEINGQPGVFESWKQQELQEDIRFLDMNSKQIGLAHNGEPCTKVVHRVKEHSEVVSQVSLINERP